MGSSISIQWHTFHFPPQYYKQNVQNRMIDRISTICNLISKYVHRGKYYDAYFSNGVRHMHLIIKMKNDIILIL